MLQPNLAGFIYLDPKAYLVTTVTQASPVKMDVTLHLLSQLLSDPGSEALTPEICM